MKDSKRSMYASDEIVTIDLEDGTALEVGIMGAFDVNGREYIALEDLADGLDDVYLYEYYPNENGFELGDIPEDEFPAVERAFLAIMSD